MPPVKRKSNESASTRVFSGLSRSHKNKEGGLSPFPVVHETRTRRQALYFFAAPWIFIWNFEWQLRQ